MAILFYYYWAFLVLSLTESYSVIPVVLPEHKINIRSTPALDPVEELLEKYGRDNQLNLTQIEKLFQDIGIPLNNTKQQEEQTCFSSQYFYGMYSKNDGNINRTDLIDLCPAVLYQLSKKECQVSRKEEEKEPEHTGKANPTRAWGFGFLFVTVISLGSLIGAFVVPLMDKPLYKKVLTFMVSLAVGVLGGSGVFHLIPNALGFPNEDGDDSYLWKCAMVVCGLYLFFVLECSMKLYIRFKTIKRKAVLDLSSNGEEKCGSDNSNNGVDLEECNVIVNNGHGHSHAGPNMMNGGQQNSSDSKKFTEKSSVEFSGNGDSMEVVIKESSDKKPIATVAWMIIIGDGLHNFIDGLAIGASFSSSVVSGISTSLAVISEELPHELGDFAILLNSGFTYKQAMLANFLSACTCYIGLVVGLILGYKTSAVKYIYGIAGGMFLYISLVDMLPEALEMAYSLSGTSKSKAIKMMILVNFAMVFGFCIMLVLAKYATTIDL